MSLSVWSGKEQQLTKETKKLASCILHPASHCPFTENRLFPNKAIFRTFTWVQVSLCTLAEILHCSSERLNLKPSKFSNFPLRHQLHTLHAAHPASVKQFKDWLLPFIGARAQQKQWTLISKQRNNHGSKNLKCHHSHQCSFLYVTTLLNHSLLHRRWVENQV